MTAAPIAAFPQLAIANRSAGGSPEVLGDEEMDGNTHQMPGFVGVTDVVVLGLDHQLDLEPGGGDQSCAVDERCLDEPVPVPIDLGHCSIQVGDHGNELVIGDIAPTDRIVRIESRAEP